jgi:hypothetical protein
MRGYQFGRVYRGGLRGEIVLFVMNTPLKNIPKIKVPLLTYILKDTPSLLNVDRYYKESDSDFIYIVNAFSH